MKTGQGLRSGVMVVAAVFLAGGLAWAAEYPVWRGIKWQMKIGEVQGKLKSAGVTMVQDSEDVPEYTAKDEWLKHPVTARLIFSDDKISSINLMFDAATPAARAAVVKDALKYLTDNCGKPKDSEKDYWQWTCQSVTISLQDRCSNPDAESCRASVFYELCPPDKCM